MNQRTQARSAARLAAVQALYQHEMEATALAPLLDEFHMHRLGAEIDDDQYAEAETAFFDDLVKGVLARREEIDALLASRSLVQDHHHCPHGRPTALVFTREALDKQFGRI